MLAARAVSVLILALAVPSVACTAGTSSTSCALNTCTSTAVLKTFANIPKEQMAQATIFACIDTTCVSGTPASVPGSPGDRLTVTLQGALTVQGYITAPDPQKGYLIEADFDLGESNPQNGDRYQLYVMNGSAKVDGGIDKTATYQTETPNGPSCPPVCQNAVIDQTQ